MITMLKTKKTLAGFIKKHGYRFGAFLLFAFLLSLFPSLNLYFASVPKTSPVALTEEIELPSPPPFPVNKTGQIPPEITAAGVFIEDIPSGIVLYAKNESQRFPLASTTKIVTALVALDHYRLEDILTVKTVMGKGRTMGLITGEQLTFESLLYGALVHSANDAAYAIAENYPGGVEKFVEMMNKKAASFYLSNTHFTEPVGFDDQNQYTTPADLAKLAKAALDNKIFAKMVGIRNITVSDVGYTYFHPLNNVNELLGKIPGVAGVKTGFTQNAGEILVSTVRKNEKSVIFVVLKSQNRFGETATLIDWVFSNFVWMPIEEIIPTKKYQERVNTQQSHYLPQRQK